MRIGIDISQIVYEATGVSTYVKHLVTALVTRDRTNTYVLFGASFRRRNVFEKFFATIKAINPHVELITVPIPPSMLDFLWNRMHTQPVEKFTGPLDVFWSSDWTQPPLAQARGVTTVHDISPLLFPREMDKRIVETHKRRLRWVKKECQAILCDSEATRNDLVKHLGIPKEKLYVVYPGL